MGSQTLEILRQGVWASLTGGWFYDPHQNLFCNTVHLYIWLFLLCLPFSVYLYFPSATVLGWIIYCSLVAVVFTLLKLLNHGLHHLYDTSEWILIPRTSTQPSHDNTQREEGMELQTLRASSGGATQGSDNESVTSLEYHKPNNSTIDLKVDVHRKNSSESSVDDPVISSVKPEEPPIGTKIDLTLALVEEGSSYPKPPPNRHPTKGPNCYRKDYRIIKGKRYHGYKLDKNTEQYRSRRKQNNDDPLDDQQSFVAHEFTKYNQQEGTDRQTFFDPLVGPIECEYLRDRDRPRTQGKLRQQLSLESRDITEMSAGAGSPKKKLAHRRRYANYPDESCTKSTMALTNAQCSNMRRNSNSTMSTIQLPLLNSTAQLVSHMRRHSHNTDAGFFASVELGAYMLENNETPPKESDLKNKAAASGFRRIKSAALEIGCPPPSVSNLSPHPNSVETIGGQVLKNPKSAVIPPPSKCLTRGPHLNLYPKNDAGEGCSYPYLNYGSEIVYPIAEISDEMQTSQKETDLDSSGDSYSDYYDEHANMKHQFRGFDWDADQSPAGRSSDSDYENNGSRSPLLDHGHPTCVIKKSDIDSLKCCSICKASLLPYSNSNKSKSVRTKRPVRHETHFLSEVKFVNETNKNVESSSKNLSEVEKSVKNEPPDGDKVCEGTCEKIAVDNFDKVSASSKDLLIEKSSLESNENHDKGSKSNEASNEPKPWDQEIYNTSSSTESNENKKDANVSNIKGKETEESHLNSDGKSADEKSLYSIDWLFEEPKSDERSGREGEISHAEDGSLSKVLGEATNVPKNLGAIPKQIKNITRSRASSEKENKRKQSRESGDEELIYLDAVEAQAALVQGLECLFAATNANTVVMPQSGRDDRPRSRRPHSLRGEREQQRLRKRSVEEAAQTSSGALLPTSMPLLAAFLNSRVEFPNMPICLPDASAGQIEARCSIDEGQRTRIMDRNHRNRVRKIKRSTRQRNQAFLNTSDKRNDTPTNGEGNAGHYATSFEDTSEGAIHCFMDEYGNWMSYSFDKNVDARDARARVVAKEDPRVIDARPRDNGNNMNRLCQESSSGSLESEAGNVAESAKAKRGDSVDHSSSNQGSNNPLIASNTNLSSANAANKRFYMFDVPPCTSQSDQPRSPVAYVTDSLLERIEAERQSRMGFPSMHINFLMNQQRQQQLQQQQQQQLQQQTQTDSAPEVTSPTAVPGLMPSIGEEYDSTRDNALRNRLSKLMDSLERPGPRKLRGYYKMNLGICELKVTMDRLKLMALFDRNLTIRDTFISIALAIMVAVLGSITLNFGFYKDAYAFWFCFIMAGSQYSLLKSVQPDSSSPVHGFNKMVVFSRPVYFCLCTAMLCGIHNHLTQTDGDEVDDSYGRQRRSIDRSVPLTVYGFEVNEKDFLLIIEWVLSKFILFFPLAFSFGFFPQVNTFVMYLLEQIDMHAFGGNATSSLSAAVFCTVRSLAAVGAIYGFAYSGLVEGNKSQHKKHNILLSIFCGILVPMSYHLSRTASDYTLIWNLIKKHLLPPELYVIHNPDATAEPERGDPATLSEVSIKGSKKNNSESNISKQHSIGSSASKINFSSETNISKSQKRSQTSSVSSLKFDARDLNSNSSLKGEGPTEPEDKSSSNAPNVKVEADRTANQSADKSPDKVDEDMEDPLPKKLQATVNARLKNDVIVCTFLALIVFGLHCTTVFSTLSPQLNTVLWIIAGVLGWILHYIWPQLRKQQPWLCVAGPILRSHEHGIFEVSEPAKLMWFEKIYVYLCFLERNVLYPAIVIAATTQDAPAIAAKYGDALGALIISVCALKCLRNAYSETASQYLIITFAVLIFQKDFTNFKLTETFLVDYFITAIIFNKVYEFLLKIQFVVTYIAPWQITWGSAFHAFAQPFSVPHSAMLFLQAALSALISSPLTPVLGSAIFMTSYVRPVKFWERDYNTKRVDQSNTRLSSQLERNLGADDNNLNSIFYEHLTRSLQHFLCGDLMLGRWGQVQQGDCFVLASDYLNCLVHIVELGNGLVSFQLRGLEFRGTYCQQREVEAISDGPEESNEGVLNNWTGLSRLLTPSTCWALRWLAWQLAATKYVLQGYSVSDNSATSMLQVFEFRKVLLTYYVKSIIYYTIQSNKLEEWLSSPLLVEALKPISERNFVDLDPIFNSNLDEDYDFRASGITRGRFFAVYHEWISHCGARRDVSSRRRAVGRDSPLVTLVFALSLVGRRALAAAQHLPASSVEFFLHGLHALFKGDFRITCARDEWVFADMALLHAVLAPAVRMALKLHQDHFMFPEEYCSCSALYSAILNHSARLVICHEAAPAWRHHVLRGAPHLLALRHVLDEGNDDYKIIMLNKRHLGFRVIKLNRECVRGLWAGQQQELVYLRNRNPERGSIQNAKQVLRNIINSSCDQPIGYPIYVSPLTTSYSDTSEQLCSLVGGPVSVTAIRNLVIAAWRRIRRRCGEGCSSGGGAGAGVSPGGGGAGGAGGTRPAPAQQQLHLSRTSLAGTRGSLASAGKPTSSTLASLAGLLREHSHERTHDDGGGASAVDCCEGRRRSDDRLNMDRMSARRHARRRPTLRQQHESRRARSSDDDDSDDNIRRTRYPLSEKAKALSKPSKEIRHERESYRELTGKYTELSADSQAASQAARDAAKYGDLSGKESSMRMDRKGKEVKPKIKRSDSGRSSLKMNVSLGSKVVVTDPAGVYDCINLGRRIDVLWPSERQRELGGRNHWGTWVPLPNMDGLVVHKWTPNHRDPKLRSHVDKTILLVQIEDKFVPIAENCVQDLGDEV